MTQNCMVLAFHDFRNVRMLIFSRPYQYGRAYVTVLRLSSVCLSFVRNVL